MITLRPFSFLRFIALFLAAGVARSLATSTGLQDIGSGTFTDGGATVSSADYIVSGSISVDKDGTGAFLTGATTGTSTITVSANNSTVGSFELGAVTLQEFVTSGVWNVYLTANKLGGGTIDLSGSPVTGTAGADNYSGAWTSAFSGVQITSFTVHFTESNSNNENLSLRSFNVVAAYGLAPTVSSVSPTSGSTVGGTSVTITGTNLTGATGVSFGGTAGTGVVVNGATSVTVNSPAHAAGVVDITVTTANGTSATSASDQFTYAALTPTITSATYDASTGALVVTGTNFAATSGATNDIVASKFTLTGEGGSTYTLTTTPNVEISSATAFTLTLSAVDRAGVNVLLNKNGATSTGGTTYNLAGAAGFVAAAASTADASATISVSNSAPIVIDAKISISGASGTGGAYKIGDTVTATWNNTVASGDKNTNISTVTVDFSQFGGGAAVSASNSSNTWTATYPIVAGAINGTTNRNVSVTATDSNAQSTTTADTTNATVDNQAPAAPSTPDLSFLYDSGSSNTDNITSVTTPSIGGTAEASSTVTLYDTDGTTVLGTATATGGNWSITSSALSEGSHTLTAKATDAAGNVSVASSGLSVTIDTSAPAAPSTPDLSSGSDSGSSNTDNITSVTTPTFTGTAEASSTVTLYDTDGTTVLGTATATGGNWSITSSALSEGSHTVTAKATDVAGNVGTASSGLGVTIDTTAPTTTIATAAFSADTGTSSTDFITKTAAQTISGTTSANLVSGEIVEVSLDNGSTWTTATTSVGANTWSLSGQTLTASNTLKVRVTDTAGNSGTTFSQAYVLDTSAPAAPSTPDLAAASDSGSSNTDNITSVTTPTFTGTAEASSAVTLYDTDGTTVLGTATATGGNWSITSSALSEGSHTVTAKATDAAGNVGVASSGLSVTIDTTAPTTTIATAAFSADTGSSSTDFITNTAAQTISGTTSANLVSGEIVEVSLDNGSTWTIATTSVGANTWSLSGQTLTASNTLKVRVTDTAGNSGTVASQAYVLDTTAPTTTIATAAFSADTGTSNTDFITATAAQTISGTLSANIVAGEIVQVSLDNGSTWTTATTSVGANTWSLSGQTLTASNTLKVRVTDTAGNSGTTFSQAYVLDTTAPTTTIATAAFSADTGSSATDFITNTAAQTISGTLSANIVAGEIVQVSLDNGSTWTTATTSVGANTWSLSGQTLTASNTLKVRVTDTAGNSGTVFSQAYVLDTTAPTTTIATAAFSADTGASSTDFITKTAAQTISGTTSANLVSGEIVEVSLDNGSTWTTATTSVGANTWSLSGQTLTASNTLKVRVTDTAGNSGTTFSQAYVLDTTAPAAPSAPDLAAGSDSGSSNTDNITSVTTPIFAGTAEASSTVTLYDTDGTTVLGTATATGGNWSITSSALSEGSHTLTAKATDAAGNVSVASSGLSVTVDTTAPTTTIATAAFSADTGTSSTDFITNTAAQTISGTLSANMVSGEIVEVSLDNGSTWTTATTSVGANTWSLSGQTLTASNTLKVRVTDAAGNTGTVFSQAYLLDSTAPTATIATAAFSADTGISSTDFLTMATAQTISGTLSANMVAGEIVEVSLDNGATWATATTTVGQNTWSLSSQTLTASNTLKVRVTDTAGNSGTVFSQAYVLDTSAPAAPAITGITTDTGASSSDGITSDSTLVFAGTAEANSTVTMTRVGTGVIGTTTADGSGNWSFDYTGHPLIGDGVYTFTATATDAAGNASSASSTFTVTEDTTPPTAPTAVALTPTGGAVVANALNATNTDLTASATITAGQATGGKAELYIGATLIATDNSIAGGDTSVTFDIGTSTTGALQLAIAAGGIATVKLYDLAGNVATSSVANPTLNVDYTAPTAPTGVTLTPVGGTVVANSLNATNTDLTATATITAGQATGGMAELYIGSTLIATDNSIAGGDALVTFDIGTSTTTGLQAIVTSGGVATVKLYDSAGNVTTSSVGNPTLTVDYTAPTAPTAVTLTPVGGTVVANTLNATNTDLTASATITTAQATGGKAELYIGATLIATDSSIAGGDTSVTFDVGTSTTGGLQTAVATGGVATVRLYDAAGNSVTSSVGNPTLIVTYTPPTAPTAVTLTPVGGTIVANALNATNTDLTASATITAGQATGGKAELYIGATLIATDNSIAGGDTSVTFDVGTSTTTALQVAVTTGGVATVKLYDASANTSISSVGNPTLVVDYSAPTLNTISRQVPGTVNTAAASVTYRVAFNEGVTGVDVTDFALTVVSGTPTGTIASVNPVSTSVYDVAVNTIAGQGQLRLDLKASGTGIADLAGNALADGGFTTGDFYIAGVANVFDAVNLVNGATLNVSNATSNMVAQRFTTAASAPLSLTTVTALLGSVTGSPSPVVTIVTDNSGVPGSTVVTTLTNPTSLTANTLNVWTSTQLLAASTTYWAVFSDTSASGVYTLQASTATSGGIGTWITSPTDYVFYYGVNAATGPQAGALKLAIGATSTPTITSTLTASGTYGTAFGGYTITATNLPTSFAATGLPTGLTLDTSTGVISGTPTQAGSFNVSLTGTNGSGTGVPSTLVLTVAKAALTATADNKTRPYGAGNPALTVSYTGLRNGDTAASFTEPVASTSATSSSQVGTYAITVSGGTSANYTFSYASGTLTILAASQTITFAAPADATLGQTVTLTATASSGLTVSFSVVSGPATVSGNIVSFTGTGSVTVRASQSGNVNFFSAAPSVDRSFNVTAGTPPVVTTGTQIPAPAPGSTATLSVGSSNPNVTYQWQRDGSTVSGATGPSLTLTDVQPPTAGLYTYTATIPGGGSGTSNPVIVGISTTDKVIGTGSDVGENIVHPNGNTYDQVLLQGPAATVTADTAQITRISFVDLTNDIVQVEFSGAGTLSVTMDGASSPSPASNYNQPGVDYVKGHAGLVITGANETSNITVFSVGPVTAVNSSLFKAGVTYDGVADIAFIAIQSTNGKFGSVRTGNANYFATTGFTGVYAPGVQFSGPVNVGDISASDSATPVLILGSATATNITGGDLFQPNGQPVKVSGITQLKFVSGTTSQGTVLPAQANRGVLQQDGVNVTTQIVVNP